MSSPSCEWGVAADFNDCASAKRRFNSESEEHAVGVYGLVDWFMSILEAARYLQSFLLMPVGSGGRVNDAKRMETYNSIGFPSLAVKVILKGGRMSHIESLIGTR